MKYKNEDMVGWEKTYKGSCWEVSWGWAKDIPLLPRVGWNSVSIWASIARRRVGISGARVRAAIKWLKASQ